MAITNMIVYKILNIDEIFNNFDRYCIPHKMNRLKRFRKCFSEFLKYVDSGGSDYFSTSYYNYMNGRTKRKRKKIIEEIVIYKSISKDGLINPIDMYICDGNPVIERGYRRIVGLKHLERKEVPCRIFDSIESYNRLKPSVRWK